MQESLFKNRILDCKMSNSIKRNFTDSVKVSWNGNNVFIGGNAPIVVQSMTDTRTSNVIDTAMQIKSLYLAGSDLVRITVDSSESARNVIEIRNYLDKIGIDVPLIGDFHYNGHKLLSEFPDCAQALSKYRINPGNIGLGQKRSSNFSSIVEIACKYEKPIRIGANWGSLDQELLAMKIDENLNSSNTLDNKLIVLDALISSVLESAEIAKSLGMKKDSIVISCKVSDPQSLIMVYEFLANNCNYPLHIGLTEAGSGTSGIVYSTSALSILLNKGIGDTIRISITPNRSSDRSQEVIVAQNILQSLGLRFFSPKVISCPGCGRTSSNFFQNLAYDIKEYLYSQMPTWKIKYPGVENLNVAIMGCIVNGPGESKNADIGISLPGDGENPVAPVFINGKRAFTLKGDNISEQFKDILCDYIASRYT